VASQIWNLCDIGIGVLLVPYNKSRIISLDLKH